MKKKFLLFVAEYYNVFGPKGSSHIESLGETTLYLNQKYKIYYHYYERL